MPNPGSPEAMRAQQAQMSSPFSSGMMISMMLMLVIMFVVMGFRIPIGQAMNGVFHFIDFDGAHPVLTLVLAGLIMITFSTAIRLLITDVIGPAMSQYKQRKFTEAYRQARLSNNLNLMKKYEAMQPKMMEATTKQSSSMMMSMPVTMILILPVYAWIYYFVGTDAGCANIAGMDRTIILPWGVTHLNDTVVVPVWIIIYSLISLPIGQLEQKIYLYYKLGKRLDLLNQGITPPEWKPFYKKLWKKKA